MLHICPGSGVQGVLTLRSGGLSHVPRRYRDGISLADFSQVMVYVDNSEGLAGFAYWPLHTKQKRAGSSASDECAGGRAFECKLQNALLCEERLIRQLMYVLCLLCCQDSSAPPTRHGCIH